MQRPVLQTEEVVEGFITHEEQAEQDARYWRNRPAQEKMRVITELAEWYAQIHGIDLDAQGPKRIARVVQRVRG